MTPLPALTEDEFLAQVVQLARLCGWRAAHFRPARTAAGWRTPVQADGDGWPDLILCRRDVLLAAELKVGRRQPTPAQLAWLDALRAAGAQTFCWRPEHWPAIERELRG